MDSTPYLRNEICLAGCSEDTTSNPTTRSHHSLTRREVFQNLANRILYSRFYMVLYIVMAVLSVWSIFLSFHQGCASSPLFVILESIINCTMIAEVGLRLTALGKVKSGDKLLLHLGTTMGIYPQCLIFLFVSCFEIELLEISIQYPGHLLGHLLLHYADSRADRMWFGTQCRGGD